MANTASTKDYAISAVVSLEARNRLHMEQARRKLKGEEVRIKDLVVELIENGFKDQPQQE